MSDDDDFDWAWVERRDTQGDEISPGIRVRTGRFSRTGRIPYWKSTEGPRVFMPRQNRKDDR